MYCCHFCSKQLWLTFFRCCLFALFVSDVTAVPSSLNALNPANPDTRTLDKLFDGRNDTYDDRHMWLAPLLPPPQRNVLYVFFDAPIALSCIKLWNYSKTPARGVQSIQVLMDDVIIYDGVLRAAPSSRSSSSPPSFAQSLLFCSHPTLLASESVHVYRDVAPQDVLLVDERRFVNQPSAMAAPPVPHGKTHAQVAAANSAAHKEGAQRPHTMARGQAQA
jgi:hypothetical protein